MSASPDSEIVSVPLGYPASLVYVDESGTVANDRFFVVGAVKVRRHGQFSQLIRGVRDRSNFYEEFRFNRITRAKLPVYFDLVDALVQSDAHFHACVVDRTRYDPFEVSVKRWEAHAQVTAQLLRGCINRRELVSVSMDMISAPADIHIEDEIRSMVNKGFRNISVVTAACLDSKACDGLQMADLLAGAVAFERRAGAGAAPNSHKARVVDRIRTAFNLERFEGRTPRVNVLTLQGAKVSRSVAPQRVPVPGLSSQGESR